MLTTNMTPPRGRMNVRTSRRDQAFRQGGFPPLANRVLGLQPALSVHADDGQ